MLGIVKLNLNWSSVTTNTYKKDLSPIKKKKLLMGHGKKLNGDNIFFIYVKC